MVFEITLPQAKSGEGGNLHGLIFSVGGFTRVRMCYFQQAVGVFLGHLYGARRNIIWHVTNTSEDR